MDINSYNIAEAVVLKKTDAELQRGRLRQTWLIAAASTVAMPILLKLHDIKYGKLQICNKREKTNEESQLEIILRENFEFLRRAMNLELRGPYFIFAKKNWIASVHADSGVIVNLPSLAAHVAENKMTQNEIRYFCAYVVAHEATHVKNKDNVRSLMEDVVPFIMRATNINSEEYRSDIGAAQQVGLTTAIAANLISLQKYNKLSEILGKNPQACRNMWRNIQKEVDVKKKKSKTLELILRLERIKDEIRLKSNSSERTEQENYPRAYQKALYLLNVYVKVLERVGAQMPADPRVFSIKDIFYNLVP
jgi:hypothetical protein